MARPGILALQLDLLANHGSNIAQYDAYQTYLRSHGLRDLDAMRFQRRVFLARNLKGSLQIPKDEATPITTSAGTAC